MFKNRKESIIAIIIILISGWCYMNQYIAREVALAIAMLAFLFAQAMQCYHMYKEGKDWRRLAIMTVTFALILLVLLIV